MLKGTLVLIMWLNFVMQNRESRIDIQIVQYIYKRRYQKCVGIDHIFFTKKIVQEEKWGVASVTEIVTLQNYAKLTESCELKFCGL